MSALTAMPRAESWQWRLLDGRTEAPIGTLDGVTTGHLDWSIFNRYRMGGTVQWEGTAAGLPSWSTLRLQPVYTAITDEGVISWPMGIYLPSTPRRAYGPTGVEVGVQLFDKSLILDQAKVQSTYTIPAGATVTDALTTLISTATADGLSVATVDSAQTLLTSMVWKAGTSILTIANEALDAINYWSLHLDRYGVFQLAPHEPAEQREPQWTFDEENSIYDPSFQSEQDTFEVPNQVILNSATDGTTTPLTAVASDYTSPTGFDAKGWWSAVTEDDVQTTSQATLDAMAKRRLVDLMTAQNTLTLSHAHLPLYPNEIIRFTNAAAGFDNARCSIQSKSLDTVPGSLTTAQLVVLS